MFKDAVIFQQVFIHLSQPLKLHLKSMNKFPKISYFSGLLSLAIRGKPKKDFKFLFCKHECIKHYILKKKKCGVQLLSGEHYV